MVGKVLVNSAIFALAFLVYGLWQGHSWLSGSLFALASVAGVAYAVQDSDAAKRRLAEEHLAGREPLSDQEFGEKFFSADRASIASRTRAILASHLPLDLSRMRPDDRLVADLRMEELDSFATVEFLLEVEEEFGIRVPDEEAERMRTLGDLVEYVAAALKAKGPS
jgi:acyl carrier protein